MTPQEKAKELLHRFYCVPDARGLYMMQEYQAKECALIAVDELIKNSYFINELILLRFKGSLFINPLTESKEYWQEVKQEIQQL